MQQHILASLEEARKGLNDLIASPEALGRVEAAARLLIEVFRAEGRAFSCGNGGSMSDAIHFAEELSGRYRSNRPGLSALAMSDVGHLTCVANDFGYDAVFSRYVESHGRAGDCLLAISTSGKSPNVIKAVEAARARDMKVISLTGKPGSALGVLADVDVCTPAGSYADRVQELHIKIIHILIELVEREFFPANYA